MEFRRVLFRSDRCITILQPDVSKTGGVTELMRIAAMASGWKIPINPHTCTTSLNMATTIHALASMDNAGYFEADVAIENPFRTERSEEHTSELQSLMRISYAVFCLKKKTTSYHKKTTHKHN